LKKREKKAVEQAKSTLRHGDIEGQVQQGRDGFGLGTRQPTCHKAIPAERKKLVAGSW